MNAKYVDRLATIVFYLIAFAFISMISGLIVYVWIHGVRPLSWEFLTTTSSVASAGGGIRDQLFNSFYILFITMLITVPLGVLGGIYMAEYAREGKITHLIRSCIEMLASLPSIVVGMFGLLVFVNTTGWGYSIIGGALALTIINIPVMVRVSEDAIRAVPQELRQASLALGLSKWYTIRTVIIPAAFSNVLTGAILASGRVFGEAAALLFTAGLSTPRLDYTNWNIFSETSPFNLFRPAETLAVHIWSVNTNGIMPDVTEIAAGGSLVLVLSILLFNIFARFVGRFIEKRMSASK